ncbi:MAG: N-acetylmuramoyl-L-alanine amidase [Chloroflexota bacterium]|jgi:N-acetylmuramoyl-L-alanine amidase
MRVPVGENSSTSDNPLWRFISRNLLLLTFLGLSAAAMLTAYFYFSPSSGVAQVVAAGDGSGLLSAPFVKALPPRPVLQRLAQSPGPVRVAIISGHKGFDPGAVCEDGLTEAQVNENIAVRVVAGLQARGIPTDLLDEFDDRLGGYAATGLVSIHADSCDYINDLATGFKIAGSSFTDSSLLSICVEDHYRRATQMNYHANTITPHMTDYHAFREIAQGVPGIIIETGFMNLDREILTTHTDLVAQAITEGILCYIGHVRGDVHLAPATTLSAGEGDQ